MTNGTTKSGFSFELSDHIFEDYELTEALVNFVEKRTEANLVALERKLFDGAEDCKKAAHEFLKADKGYFTSADMELLISEIITAHNDLKNS
jgi:hypothetical protein